jgi:uncharacterized damage-inducible protein DinB
MNPNETLDKSHQLVIAAVDDLPEAGWDVPQVCGEWSVKDVIAHLASYELLLVDVLKTFLGEKPSPYLARFARDGAEFNTAEVEARKYATAQHVLDEYNDAQVESMSLLGQVPAEMLRKTGTVPWYGVACCLEDVISSVYAHTREHCDQIVRFRERI